MSINTLLFDLDGTLTDPKVGITTCIRYGLEQIGHSLPENTDLDWCIGPPLKQSLASLLNTQDDDLAEQALAKYRERFGSVGLFENELYPNVAETLAAFQQAGYTMFVATAKPTVYAKQIIEHFGLSPYFQRVYGSELSGERTNKGDLIAYIIEQENLQDACCAMIGDREYDVLGGKRHGMKTISVSYGYGSQAELDQANADVRVDTFKQLLTVFPMTNKVSHA